MIVDAREEFHAPHSQTQGESHPVDTSEAIRFWSKVDRSGGPSDCWIWRGACHERGYGRLRWRGRIRSATHVALHITKGRLPEPGVLVLHHCDVQKCVNPAHLYEGTQRDNMRDRFERGRTPQMRNVSKDQAEAWIKKHRAAIAHSRKRIRTLERVLSEEAPQDRPGSHGAGDG